MNWLTDPQIWISLTTLTALEIVLGIDNIIFISILAGRLPAAERLIPVSERARAAEALQNLLIAHPALPPAVAVRLEVVDDPSVIALIAGRVAAINVSLPSIFATPTNSASFPARAYRRPARVLGSMNGSSENRIEFLTV